jgi:hypothetical protein
MAANKILDIEPIAVPASIGNLLNCGITSLSGPVGYTQTQPYILIKHIRLTNRTSSAITVTLYKGATGGSTANTEFGFAAVAVPANQSLDFYTQARFEAADFLTGVASGVGVTANIAGEIGLT